MHMLIQKTGKITGKQLGVMYDTFYHTPIGNILRSGRFEKARALWFNAMQESYWSIVSEDTIKKWGKPNINCRNLEASPGVWLFNDSVGVAWIIYSDLHHKHPWKGTSFEVYVIDRVDDEDLCGAINRFLDVCRVDV